MSSQISLSSLFLITFLSCFLLSPSSACSLNAYYEKGLVSYPVQPGTPLVQTYFTSSDNPRNNYHIHAADCECLVIGYEDSTFTGKKHVLRLRRGMNGTMPFKGANIVGMCSANPNAAKKLF